GYAITTTNTPYILKTTNGGDNWSIIFTDNNIQLLNITFLNNNTGFVGRGYTPNGDAIYKTTNGGANWSPVNTPTDIIPFGMFVLNEDTIWIADNDGLVGGLYRTQNGGTSWIRQVNLGAQNPDKIYMYNKNIGFMAHSPNSLYKTTNGGFNWVPLTGGGWSDIYFIDSLTGWKANTDMKKTTDGGLNWVTQTLPYGGIILNTGIASFTVLNRDTILGVGGNVFYGGGE
ncbi:MAG TPA: YCF48-related protein, partial [Ignavibacteria bacterium]